jgi:hypothetical protein
MCTPHQQFKQQQQQEQMHEESAFRVGIEREKLEQLRREEEDKLKRKKLKQSEPDSDQQRKDVTPPSSDQPGDQREG